jgi:pilus assembly protein CpaE
MLRGVIICPDQDLGERLQNALEGHRIGILRRVSRYPNMVDLVRFLRATAPQVVFLSVESRADALDVAARIAAQAPGTQIVAVSSTCDPQTLLETMRAGIREFLAPPFEPRPLAEMLFRIEETLEQRPVMIESTDSLFAFLPAKAGVGATTVAVNASLALAEMPDMNVLLADFDLNCGLVGFMLRMDSQYSVVDAAENALDMDENLWPKLVSSIGNLDVLPAGKLNPGFRIEPTQIRHLVEFARRNYKAICVDLSGLMEKFSLELLHEAKKIFLVVTPEIPSLHLARERLEFLRKLDLESRVAMLLNRAEKRHEMALGEIEKLFGLPVFMSFPNDYAGVHKSLTTGKSVSRTSLLGKRFQELAWSMAGKPAPPSEPRRGLLDLLAARKKPALVQS